MHTGQGVEDYVEAEPICEYCHDTGICERQTADDEFVAERCDCQPECDEAEIPVFYYGPDGIVYV